MYADNVALAHSPTADAAINHGRTMSPLDRVWKPGFSPGTSVFSALETFVIILLLLLLQPFNGLFSRTTWVSRYQIGKTNLDFTGARESEWQWHQLGHMQACTSLQTDNHASTPPLCFFTGRMPFLPPNQQRQSTEGNTFVIIVLYKWTFTIPYHLLPTGPTAANLQRRFAAVGPCCDHGR